MISAFVRLPKKAGEYMEANPCPGTMISSSSSVGNEDREVDVVSVSVVVAIETDRSMGAGTSSTIVVLIDFSG